MLFRSDPYTVFVPPASAADFNKVLRGTYVGIGAEVNVVDDYLTIVSPLDDSPALAAGIRAGDIVTQFNGRPVENVERFRALVEAMPADRSVPVLIRRGERSLFLALKSTD